MTGLIILALALLLMIAGVMMNARTTDGMIAKNAMVIAGVLIVLAFATLIVGP